MCHQDDHAGWGCFIYGFMAVLIVLCVAKGIYIIWYGGHL
jgi:hypothetical protein